MPPKKVVEEKKVLLGRPGNNLKVSNCDFSSFLCSIQFLTRVF